MVYSEYAKVKNVLTVDTKYGKRRVCNVTTDRGDEAIWANDLNAFPNIKPGITIQVIRGAKGGLTILENTPSMNDVTNGSPSNTLPTQTYSQSNGNGHSTPVNHQEVVEDTFNDLGLPEPLTDAQKIAIHKLCIERGRLLVHSIEVMRRELDAKGIEFHEGSIRSLGVSLFINISRHLP